MKYIILDATENDKEEILSLYKKQIGREFCPWNDNYPTMEEIDFDLSRASLFVMKDGGQIIAAASIDQDEQVEQLECWSSALAPGAEMSRLAVDPEYQNQGLAREMLLHGMAVMKKRGYKSIHFLVNKHNVKALNSYNHLNFDIVGECFMYEQPFLCYEKEIE
ncbi:MAG: GNAT family N-acetyltransferase [Agathobacter sp.]|nr:GNAT family N-acetyltransferase [Agathobacter sp.]